MKRLKLLSLVLAITLVCVGLFAFTSGADDTPVVNSDSAAVVKYSEFGAKGDGVTDDYAAIKAAHDYANTNGLPVEADANATYYIGATGLPSVVIQTDTDWKGAKFIIDDRAINAVGAPSQNIPVFQIVPSLERLTITTTDVPSLAKGATNLGYAPGVDCLVQIQNANVRHYIRHGLNANSGAAQQEILLVKADGTIDSTTPPIWDYETITSIWAVPVNETPITVGNATFETLANEINPDRYISVNRGITITRSNTTIENVKHTVTQVKEYRAAYAGFFNVQNCNDILIYNCEIFCHNSSYFDDGGTPNLLGSYELGATNANNVVYDKVIQTNFFDVENVTEHNQGLMGTNYCKNMYVENSMFARFDAHCQVYNLTVKNSDLQRVNTIGFGTVKIENSNFWGSYMVDLRSDYGGLFHGDYYIKNVTMKEKEASRIALFSGSWVNHNFGYTVYQPQNIYIDNLKVEKNGTIYLYTSGLDNKPDLTAAEVDGEENLNPIVPTKLVKVNTNPANTRFIINAGPTFKNTVLEVPEGEDGTENIYHVNCDFSDSFTKNDDGYITGGSLTSNGFGSARLQRSGNGHNNLNLKTIMNGTDQALLFTGCGNPNGISTGTNICVDLLPSSNTSDTEYNTWKDYKGKSFVAAFDIKLYERVSDVNDSQSISLYTFCNKYAQNGGGFVQNNLVSMKLSDFSLHIGSSSPDGYLNLNTKLEAGVTYTFAMHVNVPENKFDLYLNGNKIVGNRQFLTAAEIANIGVYDEDNSTIIDSTKTNKMEDFLVSYVRLARINGWAVDGTLYEVDNAKLYFSEEYLGTGDLNAKPEVPANKYQIPNASYVSAVINLNHGSLHHYVDTGSTYTGGTATKWEDGNNGAGKVVITLGDGTTITNESSNGNTLVVDGKSYTGTELKNKQNIFTGVKDPVTDTNAIAIRKYNAEAYAINAGLVKGVDYWVTKDGNTYTVVPAGTPGAIKANLTAIDEGNNGNLQRLGGAMDLVNDKAVVSVTFRWAGRTSVDRLIEGCFASGVGGFNSAYRISIGTDGTLYANGGSIALAKISSDSYHNVTAEYYAVKGAGDLYSLYYDIYLDGICVLKGEPIANVANRTAEEITSNAADMFGLRYFAIAGVTAYTNMASTTTDEYIDSLYVKNIYEFVVDNGYSNTNVSNSGNTVEGYDITLGSKLELNFYMNLLPDTVADANAKVKFTKDGEVVAEKKVSDVTPDAKGLYKFTCPVNSTQMAADVKVSIVSETRGYKIYQNGKIYTDHAYSIAEYAATILAGSDTASLKAQPVVKAMLNYGAYAQKYFAEKNGTTLGELANANCAYAPSELNAANFGTGTVTATGGLTGIKAALVLDTDTVIKIYKDGALIGESDGITADKLNDDVTITCGDKTVTVSVLTIAGKVPAGSESLKDLAKALALYSAATEEYIK